MSALCIITSEPNLTPSARFCEFFLADLKKNKNLISFVDYDLKNIKRILHPHAVTHAEAAVMYQQWVLNHADSLPAALMRLWMNLVYFSLIL